MFVRSHVGLYIEDQVFGGFNTNWVTFTSLVGAVSENTIAFSNMPLGNWIVNVSCLFYSGPVSAPTLTTSNVSGIVSNVDIFDQDTGGSNPLAVNVVGTDNIGNWIWSYSFVLTVTTSPGSLTLDIKWPALQLFDCVLFHMSFGGNIDQTIVGGTLYRLDGYGTKFASS